MDTIVTILRAAHCKSTHHFFAIDSLWEVASPRGMELSDLLLANYAEYLKGAKDPDTVFKDFENHVVHVSDGYWGGAAKAAKKWLGNVYGSLTRKDWKEASYAIGVLSHYFSDPFMPLHTAQSPRETVIHRPLEWSVCCAYQEIHQAALSNPDIEPFKFPSGPQWLTDAINGGATFAHQFYETLLDDYDMNEARRFPKIALGADSKRALAQLFVTVQTGWGSVLDRIASESTVSFPKVSLTMPTLLAGIQVPNKKIIQSIESADHRNEVEKILEEFQRTGTVVKNISQEQRKVNVVRKLKPDLRPDPIEIERAVIAAARPVEPVVELQSVVQLPSAVESQPVVVTPLVEAPLALPPAIPIVTSLPKPARKTTDLRSVASDLVVPTATVVAPKEENQAEVSGKPTQEKTSETRTNEKETGSPRTRLTLNSPIVDAPAIGPKTAARFDAIGCHTVGQFLDQTAEELSDTLNVKWINAGLIMQWQQQARLCLQVDRLTAAGAALLVNLEIHSAEQLASHAPSQLHTQIVSLTQTSEGKRLIRDKEPPPLKVIERWIASAKVTTSRRSSAA